MVLWPLDAADDVALLIHGAKQLASTYEHVGGALAVTTEDSRSNDELNHKRLVRPLILYCSGSISHALTVVYDLCVRDYVSVLVPSPNMPSDAKMLL